MCGSYQFTYDESLEFRRMIEEVFGRKERRPEEAARFKQGVLFPDDEAPIITWDEGVTYPDLMRWGFPGFSGGRRVINARSETVFDKPLFKSNVMKHRCIIPSTGFFEWGHDKRKYLFRMPSATELYMAGIYGIFDGQPRYCILTTEANSSVSSIHDRMPLVIERKQIPDWLGDTSATREILASVPPLLHLKDVSPQQSLF